MDFADFGRDRRSLFGEFLELTDGIPSHDTFSRLFRLLDPVAFATCCAQYVVRAHWQIENGLHWLLDTAVNRPRGVPTR